MGISEAEAGTELDNSSPFMHSIQIYLSNYFFIIKGCMSVNLSHLCVLLKIIVNLISLSKILHLLLETKFEISAGADGGPRSRV